MKQHQFIIFLSSNTSGTGETFIQKAKTMNFSPVLLDKRPERFPFICDHQLITAVVDASSVNAVLSFVRRFCSNSTGKIAGILTSSEYFLLPAAKVARYLDMPGPDPEAIAICRDKACQRRCLAESGVPQPSFAEVASISQACNAAQQIGLPVVVKPSDGTGSMLVRVVTNLKEVSHMGHIVFSRQKNERGLNTSRRMMVEEYLNGPEFSIELFNGKVVGITQKLLGPKPNFVEVGHIFPADIQTSEQQRLTKVAIAAVRALGLVFGPVHVEARLVNGQPHIIEANARLAGGYIPKIIELTGVDLISATLALVTKSPPPPSLQPKAPAAAIRFILAPGYGKPAEVAGLHEAQRSQGVEEVKMYTKLGQFVANYGDFRDRVGHLIALGETASAAYRNAERALTKIKVVLAEAKRPIGEKTI